METGEIGGLGLIAALTVSSFGMPGPNPRVMPGAMGGDQGLGEFIL